ncbi:paeninodin family lasso peptide [Bacillus sp. MUM 116]|nr:paeninodin family lasso peptide [Bacillus sp. MUM 116]
MKKEWQKPTLEVLDVNLTMHNPHGWSPDGGHISDIVLDENGLPTAAVLS